jgi:hypothetical protein
MGEGFIVRKGGAVTEQALAPTITEVSTTDSEIVFTITNNDASTAVILWEVDDATPDENSIELAAAATSSNITVDTLDDDTEYTVSATASVTGKVLSNVTSLAIETDALIYTAATGGATEEYDSGGKRYKSHTFTSNGTFEVTTVGDAADDRNKVDYLIIAGGGGASIGGGGAGGYRTTITPTPSDVSADAKVTVTATTYGVTIGAGGSGSPNGTRGVTGTNSQVAFSSTIISDGGGGGGTGGGGTNPGINGGSGGGGHNSASGGTGISGQGRNGGTGTDNSGGGGGGAGAVGATSSTNDGGNGGNGLASIIRTGSNETRAGGGGGYGTSPATPGTGGTGGGGNAVTSGAGASGTANTGSGGGAGLTNDSSNGNGGSGIVIIRYEIAPTV